ncbi:hypothetical protein JTE90_004560 [Oedothorax gibbosus]|uniref:Chitin-binding type-2 domain-containing protein n=1 Tax=Oedothorax gibbosus TaxID=931172 RepID=A0AAV6UL62_9ARAC|nr:hypothetical protein JTE90_004560 [Oedothorax gibbosus]
MTSLLPCLQSARSLVRDSTMKRVCLLVVLFATTGVLANEISEDGSYGVYDTSEDTVHFDDSSVDYATCIAEGTCEPLDMSDEPVDEGYLQDSQYSRRYVPDSHYSKMCNKLGMQMQELETLHPELKNLKLKLLRMLDESGSGFKMHCNKGESIITKLLDSVIYLAEKLKADFSKVPVVVSTSIPSEEIIAEEHDVPVQVGSVRGIPGEHYPNYSEVPLTSFSCSDKMYIPGFYADLETGCQVFHVCYEHRRESFLCPVGTIFNQPILACDYWYSSNCSQAPLYYDVNAKETKNIEISKDVSNIGHLITTIIEGDKPKHIAPEIEIPKGDFNDLLKFLPIKAKIVEFEQPAVIKPKPVVVLPKPVVFKPKPLPLVKPKLVVKAAMKIPLGKAAIKLPIAKAKFAALPVVKTKVVSAAVPVMKAKVAVPLVKAKVAVPIIKSKFVAMPLMKTKYAAASVPVFKAKTTAKVIPFVKLTAKKSKVVAGVPLMKAKFAKSAVISPMTKKALALGYMKLLKAKKLALMG